MKAMLAKSHRSLLTNIRGFSLAGALAAGGLMGGLALVLAELSKQQVKMEKRGESNLEVNALSDQIRRTLDDGNACYKTIENQAITHGGGAIDIDHIKNAKGRNVISKGSTYGNDLIKIVFLSLRDFTVSGTTAEFNLQVTFEKTSGAITGYKRAVRSFPIAAELDGSNQPLRCNSTLRDAIDLTKSQLCTFLGGTFGGSTCTPPTPGSCPTGKLVQSYRADGNPDCLSPTSGFHTPQERNCFLLTTYYNVYERFKDTSTSATLVTEINRWRFNIKGSPCPATTSCTFPPCTGTDCPASGTTHCPPCDTNGDPFGPNWTTPKGCPSGYTHRFLQPGSGTNEDFYIEHYCCMEP